MPRDRVPIVIRAYEPRGYRELASDALLDNVTSHRAHEASGFAEVERAVKYRMPL